MMAVYTKLSYDNVSAISSSYDSLGELVAFEGISEGTENSNFLITTQLGKFILTIYENRVNSNDIPFFLNLLDFLALQGLPCATSIKNSDGNNFSNFQHNAGLKYYSIFKFLEGHSLSCGGISAEHCFELGSMLAKLHTLTPSFLQTNNLRANDFSLDKWWEKFMAMHDILEAQDKQLTETIEGILLHLSLAWKSYDSLLPKGICHNDLFPDNVFWNSEGRICGLLDFYFTALDFYIYDIAICINAWCFYKNPQGQYRLNPLKKESLIEGYQTVRPLIPKEKKVLKDMLVASSLRFFLSRIYDKHHKKTNLKDPEEYKQKLEFWL